MTLRWPFLLAVLFPALAGCGPDKQVYPPETGADEASSDELSPATNQSVDRFRAVVHSPSPHNDDNALPEGFPTGVFVDREWNIIAASELSDAKGFRLDAIGYGATESILLQIKTAMAGQGWSLAEPTEPDLPSISRLNFERAGGTAKYSLVAASLSPTIHLVVTR